MFRIYFVLQDLQDHFYIANLTNNYNFFRRKKSCSYLREGGVIFGGFLFFLRAPFEIINVNGGFPPSFPPGRSPARNGSQD